MGIIKKKAFLRRLKKAFGERRVGRDKKFFCFVYFAISVPSFLCFRFFYQCLAQYAFDYMQALCLILEEVVLF